MEDCFYRVKANLDYDKIEKLFKEGYKLRSPRLDINPTGFYRETFNTILVGLAPGGTVVIWAQGISRQVEIGRFQAKKIDLKQPKGLDSHDALIFSREEREETLADERFRPKHITEKPTPFGLWDSYRDIKYPWYPTFEFHPKAKMGDVWVKYFNKERWCIFYNEMVLETPSRKNYSSDEYPLIPDIFYQKGEDVSDKKYPLPKKFSFAYKANDGLKYGGVYKFDWEETQQAFADFFAQYPNTRARLNFRVSKINNIFTIRLENEKGKGIAIPFHKERLKLVNINKNYPVSK